LDDPLIGRDIGHCTITEKLGQGGMAVVYRAHQASVNRDVAVKILTGPLALDEEFVARFRREAMAAGGLGHPNILTIYDAGTTPDGLHYIVMQYAPGGTLKALLDRGPLPPDQARGIAAQVAGALAAAHEHGIVHRDLKPSNILFARDGRPLLMDFGVALTSGGARLTRTGMAVGTPEYMSPEQAQGLTVDGRSDVYSLGIMLYEMLTGNVPFVGDTPLATLYQHVHNTLSTAHLADQGVPRWLSAIVERALVKQPEDRYASAAEMAMVLRREQAPVQPPAQRTEVRVERMAPPLPVSTAPPARRRGSPLPWVLLAVVAIAVAAGLTYSLFFRPKPAPWVPPDVTDQPTAIVLATDTPAPPPDDSGAQTATAAAALQATTEARATELAEEAAVGTRTAGEATATSLVMTAEAAQVLVQRVTAEAQATQTAQAQDALSAGTATAVAQATEAAAATVFAVATEAARATATAQAQPIATEPTPITVTPEPTSITATPEPAPITATPVPEAILFARQESGQDDLFVRRGTQEANLTQHSARDYAGAWSSDGRFIAFVSDRSGNPDVWVMNGDGSNPRNLTNDGGFDSAPAWSPDGQWIAFHSGRSGLFQIWVVRSDGSDQHRLIESGQQDYNPEWSPDGSRIAFYRTVEGDNYEIMVANADGSNVQRLTFEAGWDYLPLWTPDGNRILFKSRREGGDADRFYGMNRDGSNLQRLAGSTAVQDKTRYPWLGTITQ